MAVLLLLPTSQEQTPSAKLADLISDRDPAASFRAISDLVDLSESRREEVEREAQRLPAFYREVLESDLKSKRELRPLFAKSGRIRLKGKGRTFLEYIDEIDQLPGFEFTIVAQMRNQMPKEPFDLDLECWPIEGVALLCDRVRQRMAIHSSWTDPTISLYPTAHEPQRPPETRPWFFYRNIAIQAGVGSWRKTVDFSGPPSWVTGVGFQVMTDPHMPAVDCGNLRLIEFLDENGKAIAQPAPEASALPPDPWASYRAGSMMFSVGLAAEGIRKISRLRLSFTVRVPSEVRRYVVTEFGSPQKFRDEFFDIDIGMEEGIAPTSDCVAVRIVPKKERHADLARVPIVLLQKFDAPSMSGTGGVFTGKGEGVTVRSSWCTMRTGAKMDPAVQRELGKLRRPLRIEVAIPVGLKERTVYAEFRDIPLR